MTAVAVFGLGAMGLGMATSLLRAGLPVTGTDLSADREAAFRAAGGETTPAAEAAARADVAVIVVVSAAQTEALLFGPEGVVPRLRPGAVVVSCATLPPDTARSLAARCAEAGLHYLDAPISGGAEKAAQGRLAIMASGTPDAFAAARPALDAMAETVFELGAEAGPASAMKAVNQLLAGVHIAAAEAMAFGLSQGIPPAKTLEVISRRAGTSWMFENRGARMAAEDFAPRSAVEIFVKDLGIVSDIARAARCPAPLTAAALQQFLAAAGMGLGREDDSAVVKVCARNAGLRLPGEGR